MKREVQQNFDCSNEYEVGDIVKVPWSKPRWKVWLERLTTFRWHVRQIEWRKFKCTSTSAGAVWPEVE